MFNSTNLTSLWREHFLNILIAVNEAAVVYSEVACFELSSANKRRDNFLNSFSMYQSYEHENFCAYDFIGKIKHAKCLFQNS